MKKLIVSLIVLLAAALVLFLSGRSGPLRRFDALVQQYQSDDRVIRRSAQDDLYKMLDESPSSLSRKQCMEIKNYLVAKISSSNSENYLFKYLLLVNHFSHVNGNFNLLSEDDWIFIEKHVDRYNQLVGDIDLSVWVDGNGNKIIGRNGGGH